MNRAHRYISNPGTTSRSAKIKAAICAVAVLALAYVVFVQGGQDVTAERGARAAEGIRMTSVQAEDMSTTARAVSTLVEDAAGSPPLRSQAKADVTQGSQDTQEIADPEAWYVRRIETLVDRWEPGYSAAKADIERFEHRFRTTQDRLREYFVEQGELTESVHDSSLRARLKRRDSEEREAYDRWTAEGSELLTRALAMGRELDDMDVVIRKQQLTVTMLSQYTTGSSIPSSAESLHASLSEFRVQSDQLASDLSTHVFN